MILTALSAVMEALERKELEKLALENAK